jgi:microcephalin
LIQTAQHLEDSVYEEKFSERTTHVVCGAPRRTINVLYAIANGCWLISTEWVLQSLSAGGWLDEENYEICAVG